jgi:acetyl esterase
LKNNQLIKIGYPPQGPLSKESCAGNLTPQRARSIIKNSIKDLNIPPEEVHAVEDSSVDGIPIRIYRPSNEQGLPILYQVHGGVWVAGSLESHDNICRYLANHTKSIVVAIDYSRPPESKFPKAVNEVSRVFDWIKENTEKLKGDPKRIALIGDSAGGNMVAALSLMLKEKGSIDDIAAQILVNPALDLTPSGGSFKAYKMCVDWYLKSDEDSKDVYASPLLAKDFSKLTKTLVITCEDDALKDEGKKYFERLKTEGIEANYFEIPGEGHLGPLWAAAHPKAKSAMEEVSKTLTQVFYQ